MIKYNLNNNNNLIIERVTHLVGVNNEDKIVRILFHIPEALLDTASY
jgi:hypothetical protein